MTLIISFCVVASSYSKLLFTGIVGTCRVDRNKYQIQIPLPPKIDPSVTMMTVEEKPDVTYNDIGGCKEQIEKMREVSQNYTSTWGEHLLSLYVYTFCAFFLLSKHLPCAVVLGGIHDALIAFILTSEGLIVVNVFL